MSTISYVFSNSSTAILANDNKGIFHDFTYLICLGSEHLVLHAHGTRDHTPLLTRMHKHATDHTLVNPYHTSFCVFGYHYSGTQTGSLVIICFLLTKDLFAINQRLFWWVLNLNTTILKMHI